MGQMTYQNQIWKYKISVDGSSDHFPEATF